MASCGTSNIQLVKMLKQIGFTEDKYINFLQKYFIIFNIIYLFLFFYPFHLCDWQICITLSLLV